MCIFLHVLEVTLELKVNFHKIILLGVNINDSWLQEANSVINCRVGGFPSCTWVSLWMVMRST